MKKLLRYIFLGTLSLIPLLVVIQVVFWIQNFSIDLFKQINNFTNSNISSIIIVFIALSLLGIVGYTTEKFGKSIFIAAIEKILDKIPAIRTIYSVSKKITDIFTNDKKENKKEVALVEYPKKGIWVVAYVLNKYNNLRVLFVPTSPNPTSGYTIIVEKSEVISTTLNIEEASKFIISMGSDFVKKEEIEKKIIENSKEK